MAQPINVNGKRVGKFRGSFLLLKETVRFLRSDMEMLWVPVLAFILEMFLIGAFVLILIFSEFVAFVDGDLETSPAGIFITFVGYVICAFVVAWSQAIITHIVATRAHNGDATLGDGIRVANAHFGTLIVWSLIASTVGLVLRMIAERSQIAVKIVTAVLGAAWSIVTYFVIPTIILGKKNAFEAIPASGSVFRRTWGESIITNISLSFALALLLIAYIIALFGMLVVAPDLWIIILFVAVIGVVIFSIVSSVLGSILRTLLYMYASEGVTPQNFNSELLGQVIARKDGQAVVTSQPQHTDSTQTETVREQTTPAAQENNQNYNS